MRSGRITPSAKDLRALACDDRYQVDLCKGGRLRLPNGEWSTWWPTSCWHQFAYEATDPALRIQARVLVGRLERLASL